MKQVLPETGNERKELGRGMNPAPRFPPKDIRSDQVGSDANP
ncbi:Hypothetical protein OINT_2001276 [Brucella intermedia LMG 3301]|uniref:Uncharacterized protein n=1 Tax=Brucella intermedia LMG 3301 TaxID=641118 RepID=C4WNZ3_9HYPH|nr:Hypothetical protein OINT_2001276 [Brucella intermedia LMG 3301]ERI15973.1 hypothetical protein O206_15825 [Ochrobactrum sp. EGD-AQ16]